MWIIGSPGCVVALGSVMNTPRGQIVEKRSLLREVETGAATLMPLAAEMDAGDLEFDGRRPPGTSSKPGNAPALSWIPAADTAAVAHHQNRRRHQAKN